MKLLLALALTAACSAYSHTDATADHTSAAIEFAEGGDMESAVKSFRAATKFTPGAETWGNLAEALTDEDWAGSATTVAREEAAAARRAQREGGGGGGDWGGGSSDAAALSSGAALQGGGPIPGRGFSTTLTIPHADKHKKYTTEAIAHAQKGDLETALQYFQAQRKHQPGPESYANLGILLADVGPGYAAGGDAPRAKEALCEGLSAFTLARLFNNAGGGMENLVSKIGTAGISCASPRERLLARARELEAQEKHLDAVRALCADVDSLTVALTPAEVAGELLTATTTLELVTVLRTCGVVAVKDVFAQDFMAELASALDADFEVDQARLDEAKKRAYKERDGGRKSFENEEAAARSEARYEIKLNLKPPYTKPALTQNPIVFQLSKALLTNDLELDTFSYVTSLAGAPDMHWHNDVSPLFKTEPGEAKHQPAQGIVMVLPTVDMTRTNGPTEFMVGSHVHYTEKFGGAAADFWQKHDFEPLVPHAAIPADIGTVVLFDVRIRHRGTANRSRKRRSIMYIGYMRGWYKDIVNFKDKHTAAWAKEEQTHRKLFARLDSGLYTKKLEEMLEARGVDLKDVQSRLNYKQVELTA
jgi:ectoine hydroxylase-related dioxygenase (phytanoyl-CoA dioxygenase family)